MSNLLKYSKSPYLLQHKDNPVHWRMWNKETLDLARKENKIILVSIGYSTCHWCHVMAHESFEDEEIAALMNKYFINIKIDREERPDLDQYFMQAVQLLGISGGWPLNCFLTPDQKVFYGGTYFPPTKKYNRIAWTDLLFAIHRSFIEKNESIQAQADKLSQVVKEFTQQVVSSPVKNVDINLKDTLTELDKFIDLDKGGFGFGQKFPNTTGLSFLLQVNYYLDKGRYQPFLNKSIKKMCLGGMYDHIQGAFYRYTVDRDWKVPHFEKMAYDHALIMSLLAEFFQHSKDDLYLYFILNSIEFWNAEMRSDKGLYCAALDADSEGEEGLYYLWTMDEIVQTTDNKNSRIQAYLELAPMHNQTGGVINFLTLESNKNDEIKDFLDTLKLDYYQLSLSRAKRVRPSTDKKYILAWNALIASSYCKVYLSCFDEEVRSNALILMDALLQYFVLDDVYKNYCRIYLEDNTKSGFAFLEDYACLCEALFFAYQVSAQQVYLVELFRIMDKIDLLFKSKHGLYTFSSTLHTDGIDSLYDTQDSSLPNANSVIAQLNYYLYLITSQQKYYSQYQSMYHQVIGHLELNYFSHLSWLKLAPELLDNIVVLKSRNPETALSFNKILNIHNVLYFYTDEFQHGEIQICSKGVCHPSVSSMEHAKEIIDGLLNNE